MPGSNGIITVVRDTKDAVPALKLAYRAAVASCPDAGDTLEAQEAARAKKRQFFSQDRVETKQVHVDSGGSGPAFTIGAGLPPDQEEVLVGFLRANKDVFAWEASDLVGVPREVIEHHLMVLPGACPVKQNVRCQAKEKQAFIVQEVRKLQEAGVIREVRHPDWLANPVIIPKKGRKERICVDFTSLNKACPQDPFPLPRINQIMDSTTECDLLCFLDAFSGYHQIKMATEDVEKTVFISPCGSPIKVVSAYPLEKVLCSPNAAVGVAEWNIELQAFRLGFSMTRVNKGAALADFMAEWTDAPGRHGEKVSNNITEYEGLIAGLRDAAALGVKRLTIKGDSQLLVNVSNKEYKPKDEHMEAYLEEHVPRGANKEAYDIAKRASRREPQKPGVFEERLFKPLVARSAAGPALLQEEPPSALSSGAPARGPTSGARQLLAVEPHTGYWTEEFKDGELYKRRPNDVSLRCISEEQGRELLADIEGEPGGYRYLYVAIDKFTKWVELEAVRTIPAGSTVKFIKGLVIRFDVPNRIITDNGSQVTSNLFRTYCANLGTQICYASVEHPRSNGQAERANVEVLRGLKARSLKKKLEACGRG
ncbi:uncharacterized protein [Aegilops tauschii subsp. strangulata]|uniref:uncharacterized protein n=1 Tax=Aegilops tauschii subsp. strangulata TaxID=200361 RepID=UPI003CC87730